VKVEEERKKREREEEEEEEKSWVHGVCFVCIRPRYQQQNPSESIYPAVLSLLHFYTFLLITGVNCTGRPTSTIIPAGLVHNLLIIEPDQPALWAYLCPDTSIITKEICC
jgi:hypothetical protein